MTANFKVKQKNFSAYYSNLAEIANFVRSFCQVAGLDDCASYHVETAVDEACSNIIEHGYGGEGEGQISISCEPVSDGLKITIIDYGKKFNPKKVSAPDIKASLTERKDHGLGLFFIKNFMDQVLFSTGSDNSNILTMIKYKESYK